MTAVDPANQLAALIRVQVASLRQRSMTKGRGGPRPVPTTENASATPDLAALVAQRIRSIAPDDPQGERKALRIFLETVLLSQLGQELVADPAFVLMVDHVQQQMESDPELARAASSAARLLLESAGSQA